MDVHEIEVKYSTWDDGDQIISLNAPWVDQPWQDRPIGPLLTRQEAAIVEKWLKVALPEIAKFIDDKRERPCLS